jgi:dihydropteroate synthase
MLDSLHQPRIMGILNITDDSFSDGGKCLNPEVAVQHALQMLDAGADIIDIGAESTRPGARSVSATEEWERLHPVISGILDRSPDCYISIDTQKSFVAERAIDLGARMINDVSALEYDPEISILLVERSSIDVVLMHMQGDRDYANQSIIQCGIRGEAISHRCLHYANSKVLARSVYT